MSQEHALLIGKWSVGYDHASELTVMRLEWTDRDPITLAISKDEALALAKAIIAQCETPPPKRDRLS